MIKQMIRVVDNIERLERDLDYYNEKGYRLVNVCVIDGRVTTGNMQGGYGTLHNYGSMQYLAIFDYVGDGLSAYEMIKKYMEDQYGKND